MCSGRISFASFELEQWTMGVRKDPRYHAKMKTRRINQSISALAAGPWQEPTRLPEKVPGVERLAGSF
jgi:hypothetical protein